MRRRNLGSPCSTCPCLVRGVRLTSMCYPVLENVPLPGKTEDLVCQFLLMGKMRSMNRAPRMNVLMSLHVGSSTSKIGRLRCPIFLELVESPLIYLIFPCKRPVRS